MLKNNNGNSKIKKNGITNNETKDNKNEEKVMESKDLKSSIMTDNVSNFFNNQNQGNFQDNFSSTSYQTLHKILNKVDPKPLNANKKYNLSHLYTSDALYRTSANFKPKTNNNLIEKNGKFTPLYYKTTSKNGTKTDFYNTKHKLDNRTEKQIYLNIETEDINSDMNHNLNFNTSSSNNYHTLENKRNFFYDEHKNKLIKNKNQNKTLSIKKKKEIISSKLYKSPHSTYKKSLINFINNPYNPYATNWPNSFLKKGFQLGLKQTNSIHFGVPSLSIKQLKKNVILPPVYNIKYNQFSYNNNKDIKSNESIVTFYNKDKTIKSLNLYLNLKEKSEAELMQEYKKKIMKELNIIEYDEEEEDEDEEGEEEEDDNEEEEEDEEGEESEGSEEKSEEVK